MTEIEIRQIVENQRTYFYTGATLPLSHRIEALKKYSLTFLHMRQKSGRLSEKILGKVILRAICARPVLY